MSDKKEHKVDPKDKVNNVPFWFWLAGAVMLGLIAASVIANCGGAG